MVKKRLQKVINGGIGSIQLKNLKEFQLPRPIYQIKFLANLRKTATAIEFLKISTSNSLVPK